MPKKKDDDDDDPEEDDGDDTEKEDDDDDGDDDDDEDDDDDNDEDDDDEEEDADDKSRNSNSRNSNKSGRKTGDPWNEPLYPKKPELDNDAFMFRIPTEDEIRESNIYKSHLVAQYTRQQLKKHATNLRYSYNVGEEDLKKFNNVQYREEDKGLRFDMNLSEVAPPDGRYDQNGKKVVGVHLLTEDEVKHMRQYKFLGKYFDLNAQKMMLFGSGSSRANSQQSGRSTAASGRSTAASGRSTAASGRSTALSGRDSEASGGSGRSTAASGRSSNASGR